MNRPPFDATAQERKKYLAALRQVRAKGIMPELMATLPDNLFKIRRTAEESLIAIYWAYDGAVGLGTPPRLYNKIIRVVAMNVNNPATGKVNDEGQNARLFAFVNAALADAGILCWEQKYCHDFWRPVVGIREHDTSFGPGAQDPKDAKNELDRDADPFWLPQGAPATNTMMKNFTPDFPAYPSGHATFGAAAFHITRLFYGKSNRGPDNLFNGLAFVSNELDGRNRDNKGTVRPRHVRNFPARGKTDPASGLWRMILENARSRIFLGVHWSFDAFAVDESDEPDLTQNIGGVPLGLNIAEDIFKSGGGLAPKMTPAGTADPPIKTPDPNTSGMPTVPIQPASQPGCADAPTPGRKAEDQAEEQPESEMVQEPWPSGLSPR
ncbi:MAG: vanadium-dependent haloperoxidase [Armatimonadota bacterium]|nr:vanadium-dependent haloperoxidase [Armatimonadota bacterium]